MLIGTPTSSCKLVRPYTLSTVHIYMIKYKSNYCYFVIISNSSQLVLLAYFGWKYIIINNTGKQVIPCQWS